jgi:hypothetical protein
MTMHSLAVNAATACGITAATVKKTLTQMMMTIIKKSNNII